MPQGLGGPMEEGHSHGGRGGSRGEGPGRGTAGRRAQGVPIVARRLTNPTSIHEVAGSLPGLAQPVKDLVLP